MVRSKSAFLIRILCSFALLLAALPIHASGMAACDLKVVTVKAHCGMACCEPATPKPVKHDDCCAKSHEPEATHSFPASFATADPCDCSVGSLPTAPASVEKAVAPTLSDQAAVLPSAPDFAPLKASAATQPGIFGIDSGPPPSPEYCPDLGRAPPVSRV